jgi:hypothetical protein
MQISTLLPFLGSPKDIAPPKKKGKKRRGSACSLIVFQFSHCHVVDGLTSQREFASSHVENMFTTFILSYILFLQ